MAICILHLYAQSNQFLNTEIDFIEMLLSHSLYYESFMDRLSTAEVKLKGVGGLGCG